MLASSAKAKGRKLQQWVCDLIVGLSGSFKPDDARSASAGQNGEDCLLSPHVRKFLPITVECKSRKSFAVYKDYDQAQGHSNKYEPVLIIKGDRKKPLAVVDAEHYFKLWKGTWK